MVALAGVLAGCANPGPRQLSLAETGPVEVVVSGQPYLADLQPGPVLTVSRDTPMDDAEGKVAKDVADLFCASRSGRVSPQAYGEFAGGVWVFRGACG